ncbi:Barstar (barnase inhibitor) [Micromonospora matsumotoense]|uniref:Barstar (Barnase inhibitor) n=1 Tax=Micromonospora matsumotoense TaxID=121616 RepID=A0A1C5ADH5_9ACTN|nr:barstar family protein [Micromonospora matsumotoense]SCF43111.1 Barstar (barnase inhibitor) [Micromonospora matsumotoense]
MTGQRQPGWLRVTDEARPPGHPTSSVTVAGAAARTRPALFDTLTDALDLPGHFGRNWDALADVLADRLDVGPVTLEVTDAGLLLADEPPGQLGTLLDVVGGVSAGAREPVRLVLRDTPQRLPALRLRLSAVLGGCGVAAPPGGVAH